MKIHFRLFFYVLSFITLFFISCTKETVNQITTASGTGTISGVVNYAPPSFTGIFSPIPLKGVVVSISGSTATATTDSNGVFTLNNVGIGSYTITYHKDGYGDIKTFNFQFMGSGQGYLTAVNLNQIPAYKFNSLKDSLNIDIPFPGDTSYTFNGVFNISNPDSNIMTYQVTFAINKDATINSPNLLYSNADIIAAKNQLKVFSMDISNAVYTMRSLGMKTHNTYIFVKFYPVPSSFGLYTGAGDYVDPIKGVQYTSVGEPLSGQLYLP